ncbi:aldehyde dehydrogenase family protein [Rhodococcus triatomae]
MNTARGPQADAQSGHASVADAAPVPDAQQLSLGALLDLQRNAFVRDGIPSAATRRDRIGRLQALIVDNLDELAEALRADFGSRPYDLSMATDLVSSAKSLTHDRAHLEKWMRPRRFGNPLARLALRGEVRPVPKGVVGILGPWNFPLNLVILPAGAALAAGNRVMIRPSEVTERTTAVLARLAGEYFRADELAVVTDVHGDGADFASLRFDHLFFTGSPQIGSLVAQAAGRNLVPTTLELGGKNPVVIDHSADVEKAARRVAASRMVNGGQVCLCPDYAFVPKAHVERFTAYVLDEWRNRYPGIVDNEDYTSIINDRNFDRVVGLVEDAVAKGASASSTAPTGEALPDRRSRKIAPTVLTGVTPAMRVAEEEVFGPVLTVYPYDDLSEPIEHIAAGEHPLTLYWYGDRNHAFEQLLANTRSGSVNVNDFAVNLMHADLPFGGVGQSGAGYYHGAYGFETFTHQRAIAVSRLPVSLAGLLNAPYTRRTKRLNSVQIKALRRSIQER